MAKTKFVLVSLLSALCLCLCSCSGIPFVDDGGILNAPRLSGDMYDIQKTIEKSASKEYSLKYPSSGSNRSAICLTDITGDGKKEAVAFYSNKMPEGDVATVNMEVLTNKNGKWHSLSNQQVYATDVERLEFFDLNGDGKKEIIVGWIAGSSDKQLTVYGLKGGVLVQHMQEKYTAFACCNPDGDSKGEILLITYDAQDLLARATLYGLSKKNVSAKGSCMLDAGATSYYEPLVSCLADGRPAIYLDAPKGSGLITEVMYMDGGLFVNGAYDSTALATLSTYRADTARTLDIDGDGIPEIPMKQSAPGTNAASSENEGLTLWCHFNDGSLSPVSAAYINRFDGYSFAFPAGDADFISVSRNSRTRTAAFYAVTAGQSSPAFQIAAVSAENWNSSAQKADGFKQIVRSGNTVFAAKVTDKGYPLTTAQIKKRFTVLTDRSDVTK